MADPTPEQEERRLQELAELLGGGWRVEHGVMPVVILSLHEAEHLAERERALEERVKEAERQAEAFRPSLRRMDELEAENRALVEALRELNEAVSRYPLPNEALAEAEGTTEQVQRIRDAQDRVARAALSSTEGAEIGDGQAKSPDERTTDEK